MSENEFPNNKTILKRSAIFILLILIIFLFVGFKNYFDEQIVKQTEEKICKTSEKYKNKEFPTLEIAPTEEYTENNVINFQEYQINDNEKIIIEMSEEKEDVSISVFSINENESNLSLVFVFFYSLFKEADVQNYSIYLQVEDDFKKSILFIFDNGSVNTMSYNSNGELIFELPDWFKYTAEELSDEYIKEYYEKLNEITNCFFKNMY